MANASSPRSVRRVLAGSCREAADAVALIIAITLDPTALARGSSSKRAGDETDDARAATTARTTSKPPAPVLSEPVESQLNPSDSDPALTVGRHTFGFQLAGQALFGPAPGAMPGVALFVTIGVNRPTLWSPAVLLGGVHAWRSDVAAQGGKAAFQLDAASFDACPFRFRVGGVEARPCASALIGRLAARGSETRNQAAESARPFWVVGGAANASLHLVWLLELSARLAVGANLVQDSFEFAPLVFHQVPALTVAASLGMGLRWR